jgi:predicted aminopeptidase
VKNSFVINGLNREQVDLVESAVETMMSFFSLNKDDCLRLIFTQGALQANRCACRQDTIFNKEILNLIAQAKSKSAARRARKRTTIAEYKIKRQKRKQMKELTQ